MNAGLGVTLVVTFVLFFWQSHSRVYCRCDFADQLFVSAKL
jgi:hypothetical protein